MGMRVIDGAAAMSEFVSSYSGDCGETAELAALHVVNSGKWPLDAATLKAITQRDIGQGWASATGAEPLSSIAKDLALAGVAYVNHGYGEPLGYSWRALLDAQGGIRPLVLEVAAAGNLPGDEAGCAIISSPAWGGMRARVWDCSLMEIMRQPRAGR